MRPAPTERPVVFRCGDGALIGILHEPAADRSRVGVLIVVGGPQYRVGSHRQFVLLARAFADRGFPVFRFDYRGMGDSSGGSRTFEDVGDDIRAAVDVFLAMQPELSGVVLWGLCDAASASLMYCPGDRRVAGIVLANPWVATQSGKARTYLRHYYLQRLLQASFWRKLFVGSFEAAKSGRDLIAAVRLAGSRAPGISAPSRHTFIDRMQAGLAAFSRPVLLLISERDLTAKEFLDLCSMQLRWKQALASPHVRVVRLDGADHTFSTRAALDESIEHCTVWLAAVSAPV